MSGPLVGRELRVQGKDLLPPYKGQRMPFVEYQTQHLNQHIACRIAEYSILAELLHHKSALVRQKAKGSLMQHFCLPSIRFCDALL